MASGETYLRFILKQLSQMPGIVYRRMMGCGRAERERNGKIHPGPAYFLTIMKKMYGILSKSDKKFFQYIYIYIYIYGVAAGVYNN